MLLQQMDPHFREHPVRNTYTVELMQDGSNRRLQFPDTTGVADKHIFGISVRRKGAAGKSPTGKTLTSDATIDGSFMTIMSGQQTTFKDYPVAYMSNKADGSDVGKYMQVSLPNGFVPASSHIQIADGVTLAANEVFEVTFHFLYPNECADQA